MSTDFIKELNVENIVITTPRVNLRAFTLDDVDDMFEYASVEGVGINAGWPAHTSKEESQRIVKMFVDAKDNLALVDKKLGKVIGSFGLRTTELEDFADKNIVDIGYVLSKDYWGKGIMSEVCMHIIEYLFTSTSTDLIYVEHFLDNDKSRRVIEKSGFKYYKESIYDAKLLGTKIPCKSYIMTKEDFLSL